MNPLAAAVVAVVAIALAACDSGRDDNVVRREGEPDIISISNSDPRMVEATAKARATAAEFAKALAAPHPNQSRFAVKVPVTDGKVTEYMWLADVALDGTKFTGRLANVPNAVTGVKVGETLACDTAQLSDWMYVDDGKLVGGFTLRVLRETVSPESRERLDRQMGFRVE